MYTINHSAAWICMGSQDLWQLGPLHPIAANRHVRFVWKHFCEETLHDIPWFITRLVSCSLIPWKIFADGTARTSAVWSPSFWRTWATSENGTLTSSYFITHSCQYPITSKMLAWPHKSFDLLYILKWLNVFVNLGQLECCFSFDIDQFTVIVCYCSLLFIFLGRPVALCLVRTAAGIGSSGTIGLSWNRAVADFMGLWQLWLHPFASSHFQHAPAIERNAAFELKVDITQLGRSHHFFPAIPGLESAWAYWAYWTIGLQQLRGLLLRSSSWPLGTPWSTWRSMRWCWPIQVRCQLVFNAHSSYKYCYHELS